MCLNKLCRDFADECTWFVFITLVTMKVRRSWCHHVPVCEAGDLRCEAWRERERESECNGMRGTWPFGCQ